MKYIRFRKLSSLKKVSFGVLRGNYVIPIEGDIFGKHKKLEKCSLSEVKLLAPVEPPNIICLGLNYRAHAEESGLKIPERPSFFFKTTNTIIGPEEPIILPKIASDEVDFEAELGIVIGKRAKNVPRDKALDYVFGFTCGNDISARDCQLKLDIQWARGKSFDTFCPLGPCIETDLNPNNLNISLKLNGKIMQESNTSDMVFSVEEIVSFLSSCMTLYPKTVILTGTPSGVGYSRKPPVFLRKGDALKVEIENIGKLINSVKKEEPRKRFRFSSHLTKKGERFGSLPDRSIKLP